MRMLTGLALLGALSALTSGGAAQWSCDPTQPLTIATSTFGSTRPRIASTPTGGCFVAWNENSGPGRIQHLSADASETMPAADGLALQSGFRVAALEVDATGGALVLVENGSELRLHRVEPDGTRSWGSAGTLVGSLAAIAELDEVRLFPILAGLAGTGQDVLLVWRNATSPQLRLQRVTPAGATVLPTAGALLLTLPVADGFYDLSATPDGDLLVVWETSGGFIPLLASRYAPDGQPRWSFPTPLLPGPGIQAPVVVGLDTASDPAGNLLVAYSWFDSSQPGPGYGLRLERLDPVGLPLTSTLLQSSPSAVVAPRVNADEPAAATASVNWVTAGTLRATRVSDSGQTLWSDGAEPSIAVPASSGFHATLADGRSLFVGFEAAPPSCPQSPCGSLLEVLAYLPDGTPDASYAPALLSNLAGTGSGLAALNLALAVGPADELLVALADTAHPTGTLGVHVHRVASDGELGNGAPETVCVPSASGLGCSPNIGFFGTPSFYPSAPFTILASGIASSQTGQLVYGIDGSAGIPFGNGLLCARPPLRRTPLQSSGGSASPDCSGALSFNFANWILVGPQTFLEPGITVHAQFIYRDDSNPSGVGSTNALTFCLAP